MDRAIELYTQSGLQGGANAYYILGILLDERKDVDGAEKAFRAAIEAKAYRAAIEADPFLADVHYNLARVGQTHFAMGAIRAGLRQE